MPSLLLLPNRRIPDTLRSLMDFAVRGFPCSSPVPAVSLSVLRSVDSLRCSLLCTVQITGPTVSVFSVLPSSVNVRLIVFSIVGSSNSLFYRCGGLTHWQIPRRGAAPPFPGRSLLPLSYRESFTCGLFRELFADVRECCL